MRLITKQEIEATLTHKALIDALEGIFSSEYGMPDRHHHFYRSPSGGDNTLLLMPAWTQGYLGLKQVISAPDNAQRNKPTIHGIYTLSDADTGEPLAVMDAAGLTAIRTACASALAARYLAPRNARTLLIIGGGKVAQQLIPAHLSVRNYEKVEVWLRRPEQFPAFREALGPCPVPVHCVENLEQSVPGGDVISSATLSEVPLIKGEWLRPGQHLDLVGSFRMHMREADDEAIRKSRLFADSLQGALHESGELGLPLKAGLIRKEDVLSDLPGLCKGQHQGRENEKEITLFKSVGIAIEDLTAALLVYKALNPGLNSERKSDAV